MIITPDVFVEVFILCLSWQWNPETLNSAYTTVDKVARILHGLNVISEKQRENLHKDPRVQHAMLRKIGIVYQEANLLSKDPTEEERSYYRNHILLFPKPLVVALPMASDINRRLLLRSQRIYMTHAGHTLAQALERKYRPLVTGERYIKEIERQQAAFDQASAARGARIANYHRKVRQSVQSEET